MESHKNKNNNDGGDRHQQLRGSAQNRKSNKLANDEDKPATTAGEDQKYSSKKNLEQGNDLDLEVESLSREDLIKLVRKQMATIMEIKAHTQLETTKQEAEKSDSRQAEEFSQRIVQLKQENVEVNAELGKKLAKIEELHKEVEEKSKEVAEKAKQIEALFMQLKESREQQQHLMPTADEQQMKIQLSLETWYDWLAFVPRPRLGQIVPMIGDRKFGSILQKFLHEYGEITIGQIEIVAPYKKDPDGYPRVRAWQNNRPMRFEMAEAQMPANVINFHNFKLSYFDQSVLTFMQKFNQNGLLDNVNLWFDFLLSKDKIKQVLCHILPLINGIATVNVENSAQLVDINDAGINKEISELNMKMMEKTRLLAVSFRYSCDHEILRENKIELYCRWLYQIARADEKPRVLVLYYLYQNYLMDLKYSPLSLFIDRIKQDFLMATDPVTFFIRINLPEDFQLQQAISLDNEKTKERLLTKTEVVNVPRIKQLKEVVLLISRYPIASTKKWIVANEKDALNWDFKTNDRIISLSLELKVVGI